MLDGSKFDGMTLCKFNCNFPTIAIDIIQREFLKRLEVKEGVVLMLPEHGTIGEMQERSRTS